MVCERAANTVLEQGFGLNQPAVQHTYSRSCGQMSDLPPPLRISLASPRCSSVCCDAVGRLGPIVGTGGRRSSPIARRLPKPASTTISKRFLRAHVRGELLLTY